VSFSVLLPSRDFLPRQAKKSMAAFPLLLDDHVTEVVRASDKEYYFLNREILPTKA
jgi:hypothetical protein